MPLGKFVNKKLKIKTKQTPTCDAIAADRKANK